MQHLIHACVVGVMSKSRIHEIWQQSWQHRSFVIGIILSFIMLLTGVVSLFWTPYSVELLDIPHKLQGASTAHWLGTDHFGRDVFSMLMVGAWNSMLVSVFAIGFGAGIGVPLGALAAGKRGWVEETVMRFNDFAFAFPALLTAVMLSAVYGPGTINSVLAIGIFNIPVFARITRGSALSIYKRDSCRKNFRKRRSPDCNGSYFTQHRECPHSTGYNSICLGDSCGSRSELPGTWYTTSAAKLGENAQ